MKQILFYDSKEPFFEFSNYYIAEIKVDNVVYPSSEHYYQSQKYIGEYANIIRTASTPNKARYLAQKVIRNGYPASWYHSPQNRTLLNDLITQNTETIRGDWDDVKDNIMRKACWAKFSQHSRLKEILLDTDIAEIIENSPRDDYWGIGRKKDGKNMLGQILMEIRGLILGVIPSFISINKNLKTTADIICSLKKCNLQKYFPELETENFCKKIGSKIVMHVDKPNINDLTDVLVRAIGMQKTVFICSDEKLVVDIILQKLYDIKINVAIVGSRNFVNYKIFKNHVSNTLKEWGLKVSQITIISGGAKGADTLARKFAGEFDIQIIEFLPDWDKYGKTAGPIRNKDIIDKSSLIIAFPSTGGSGTQNSINLAKKANKPVKEFYID